MLPALERGAIVVSDRFVDSTTVYQGFARGLDMKTVAAINRFVTGPLVPDLTILLDVQTTEGLRRLDARNRRTGGSRDRIELEGIAFHRRVRAGYLRIAKKSRGRVRVVNASRGQAEVASRVWRLVADVI